MLNILKALTLGVFALTLLTGGLLASRPEFADKIFQPELEGERASAADANKFIYDHAKGVKKQFAADRGHIRADGTVDPHAWKASRTPKSEEIALVRQMGEEQKAIGKGQKRPAPPRFLPGNRTEWMRTQIPIYTSCTLIEATGRITRGTSKVGPDGIPLADQMTVQELRWYDDMIKDRRTLIPNVAWGSLLGKVCDKQGERCGPEFVIGRSKYLTGSMFGAGELFLLGNGFVPKETHISILNATTTPNLSDYNAYGGGFYFDQKPAPADSCNPAVATAAGS